MGWGYPGSTPGVNPRSQGVIPRRFKQKKFFVTDKRTDVWTDRRAGRNSNVDEEKFKRRNDENDKCLVAPSKINFTK